MRSRKTTPTDEFCDRCGHEFILGDTIHILHLGMERRDLCGKCEEIILDAIDSNQQQIVQANL